MRLELLDELHAGEVAADLALRAAMERLHLD
jgi:hypothetical protein